MKITEKKKKKKQAFMRLVQSLDDEKLSLVIHGRKALDSFKRKHLNHCFILRINFFQEINHSKPLLAI